MSKNEVGSSSLNTGFASLVFDWRDQAGALATGLNRFVTMDVAIDLPLSSGLHRSKFRSNRKLVIIPCLLKCYRTVGAPRPIPGRTRCKTTGFSGRVSGIAYPRTVEELVWS